MNTTSNSNSESFSKTTFSNISSLLAIISASVGLGNIWKFPMLTGQNGGACFLISFIVFSFIIVFPTLIVEYYLGHKTKQTALKSLNTLTNNNEQWKFIAYLGALASLFIVAFYSDVMGWILKYILSSTSGSLDNISNIVDSTNYFNYVSGNPVSVLFYQLIIFMIASIVILKEKTHIINNAVKYSIIILFGLLVFLLFFASNMPAGKQAIDFLSNVDISKVNGKILLSALGLALFKSPIGATCQWIYFSKFDDSTNPIKTCVRCIFADLIISLLCVLVIFPIVFTFGIRPEVGSGLLFITLPLVFSQIKFGKLLMILFFTLSILVAFCALIPLMNVGIYFLKDKFNFSHKKAVKINFIISFILGSLVSLSTTDTLGKIKIFNKNFFSLFDFFSSNILLPLVSALMIILVCYKLNKEDIIQHIMETGCSRRVATVWYNFTKYISLTLIILVVISSLFL